MMSKKRTLISEDLSAVMRVAEKKVHIPIPSPRCSPNHFHDSQSRLHRGSPGMPITLNRSAGAQCDRFQRKRAKPGKKAAKLLQPSIQDFATQMDTIGQTPRETPIIQMGGRDHSTRRKRKSPEVQND